SLEFQERTAEHGPWGMLRRRLLDCMRVRPRLVSWGPRPLGGHARPVKHKLPLHRAAPIQGIALERKAPQRDGPRHVRVVGTKLERIIQARQSTIWGLWEVEIERPTDRAVRAVGRPRPQLAAEQEGGPSLARINSGQGVVAMQCQRPPRCK